MKDGLWNKDGEISEESDEAGGGREGGKLCLETQRWVQDRLH